MIAAHQHESLVEVIARQSGRAASGDLRILLVASVLGLVVCAAAPVYWSVLAWAGTALFLATACLALAELCRRAASIPAAIRGGGQLALIGVALIAGFMGGLALLLALFGDPWQL